MSVFFYFYFYFVKTSYIRADNVLTLITKQYLILIVKLDFLNLSFAKIVLTIKLRRTSTNESFTTCLHGDVLFF